MLNATRSILDGQCIMEALLNEVSKDKYLSTDDIKTSAIVRDFFADSSLINYFYKFMLKWDKDSEAYYKKYYENLEYEPLQFSVGKAYIKVVRKNSVCAFIDKFGNVYKPAGWNAPAKGVRYYLSDYNSIHFDPHGGFLYGNKNLVPNTADSFTQWVDPNESQISEVKNILESSSNLYLYHATALENKDSILSDGLLINPKKHNWDNMYCDGKIFLALNAECAEDYVYSAEDAPDDIVMFKVPLQALNPAYIGYDWNNRCEYHTDINSIVYNADIPAGKLQVVTSIGSEPDQDIDSFEGTDLYDIVLDTFNTECETNLELEEWNVGEPSASDLAGAVSDYYTKHSNYGFKVTHTNLGFVGDYITSPAGNKYVAVYKKDPKVYALYAGNKPYSCPLFNLNYKTFDSIDDVLLFLKSFDPIRTKAINVLGIDLGDVLTVNNQWFDAKLPDEEYDLTVNRFLDEFTPVFNFRGKEVWVKFDRDLFPVDGGYVK